MNVLRWADEQIDRATMYRLIIYYLGGLIAVAAGLSALSVLHYNVAAIIGQTFFLVAVCWISNKIFTHGFETAENPESSIITALILALIITPVAQAENAKFLAAAGGLAIASKFILAWRGKHVFNPAAIAVVLTAFGAGDSAGWWVGTAWMLPFVLLGAIPLVRKIRRGRMVATFVGAALAATAVYALLGHAALASTLQKEILNSALFFASFVMLTEPLTSPTTTTKQLYYAALVGALFPPQAHIAGVYFTPELALAAGNVLNFFMGPRAKFALRLRQRIQIAPGMFDFVLYSPKKFSYRPGQYMEFTLPHTHPDARGARRYFTLASSPTEPVLRLGVKFYKPSSSYKQAMLQLTPHTPIIASQLGGDFTLPKNRRQKIVFIAGGIGITPFRSMLKYLLDTKQKRDIVVLYSAKNAQEFVYKDVLEEARMHSGARVEYIDGSRGKRLSAAMVTRMVPDFASRTFFLSGPQRMVTGTASILRSLHVPSRRIKKDFFSGY